MHNGTYDVIMQVTVPVPNVLLSDRMPYNRIMMLRHQSANPSDWHSLTGRYCVLYLDGDVEIPGDIVPATVPASFVKDSALSMVYNAQKDAALENFMEGCEQMRNEVSFHLTANFFPSPDEEVPAYDVEDIPDGDGDDDWDYEEDAPLPKIPARFCPLLPSSDVPDEDEIPDIPVEELLPSPEDYDEWRRACCGLA